MQTDGSGLPEAMRKWLDRYHRSSWPLILMASGYAAAAAFLYRGLQVHNAVNTALFLWFSAAHLFNGASLSFRPAQVRPGSSPEPDEPPRG
jgi:hypothetical protein